VTSASGAAVESSAAERVSALRKAAGWSQKQLARKMAALGWSWHQQTVAAVESGARQVRLGELADLAGLFGVTLPALLGADTMPAAEQMRAIRQAVREEIIAELSGGSEHAA
jgi:transcriptional regulator with XRE-family HTH domain